MMPLTVKRFVVPAKYGFGVEVPEEGAHCANCFYLGESRKDCNNAIFRRYEGTSKLGAVAEKFCCAVWIQKDVGDLVPAADRL